MNAQVEELLAKGRAEKLRRRNAHLIKLGLVDMSKGSHREYAKDWDGRPGWTYDKEKELYYRDCGEGEPIPIEVTDEEYEEICKLFPEKDSSRTTANKAPEKTLEGIASALLVIGILAFFTCLIIAFEADTPGLFIMYGLIVLAAAVVNWAIMRCFADMSSTLKDIKSKINNH